MHYINPFTPPNNPMIQGNSIILRISDEGIAAEIGQNINIAGPVSGGLESYSFVKRPSMGSGM